MCNCQEYMEIEQDDSIIQIISLGMASQWPIVYDRPVKLWWYDWSN